MNIKTEEVERALHLGEVPESELRDVLLRHFGGARQPPEVQGQVEYTRRDAHQEQQFCLRLVYHGGRLTGVEPGDDLTPDDIEALRTAVEDSILADGGSKIFPRVLFSIPPVEGWWRYRDRFQIGPLPSESPRVPYVIGQHPFLLEVRVKDSTDGTIRLIRSNAAAREINLLLGVFLFKVIGGPDGRHRAHWVFLPQEEGAEGMVASAFLQEGYSPSGQAGALADDFTASPGEEQLFEEVEDRLYFAVEGIRVGRWMRRPSSLEHLLDSYFYAAPVDRDRFLTFAFWLRFSDTAWSYAMSPSFAALVSAIEALMPPPEEEGRCECCGRPTGPGATRWFMDFVDRWATGLDVGHRRRLYALRSAIVHGGKLLRMDRDRWTGMHPQENEELDDFQVLQRTATIVGVNWLLGRQQDATDSH